MKKASLFYFIPFLIFFVLNLEAGVIDSGHNMLRQTTDDDVAADEGKAGVCSFCHIPHSSTGNTMWTGAPSTNYDPAIGEVGVICGKCHEKDSGFTGAPLVATSIYASKPDLYMNHPLVDDNSDSYADTTTPTNQIDGINGGTRQWMSGWPATQPNRINSLGQVTMECTSCHNVHDVSRSGVTFDVNHAENNVPLNGTGASGEFLRARAFDTLSELGNKEPYKESDGSNSKQIFCEYCHIGRATTGWGPWNTTRVDGNLYSTHPVGRGNVVSKVGPDKNLINDSTRRVITDTNMGWESSIVIPPELRTNHRVANITTSDNFGGHLGGGEGSRMSGIGYDTSDKSDSTGIVICQSCHKPHSSDKTLVGQTHDGNIINDDEFGKYMFGTKTPDLLVINNSSTSGYNKLCEACHSYRPFIRTTAANPTKGDTDILDQNGKPKFKGHPLKYNKLPNGSYKFDAYGDTTSIWNDSNDLCDSEPAIMIPAEWPTGGLNQPVCLSCHDVHGGRPRTKLLRSRTKSGSGNLLICDDCHKKALKKLGLTHPLGESLENTDGAKWPDQANLTIFAPPMFQPKSTTLRLNYNERKLYKDGSGDGMVDYSGSNFSNAKYDTADVKIGCDTCHDWSNGMIHYYAGRRRDVVAETGGSHSHQDPKIDPNHNSELCVSCHTGDPYDPNTDTKNYDYGINADQGSLRGLNPKDGGIESTNIAIPGANPSAWIREYPKTINPFETTALSRLGTHASGLRIEYNTSASGYRNHLEYVYFGAWENGSSNCNGNKLENLNSKLISKWGQRFDTIALSERNTIESKKKAVIICQSCHTPHWANQGLVEYNTAGTDAGNVKERTPHSAILYAPQTESFMCRNCHFPSGTHPVSKLDTYLSRWEKNNEGTRGANGGYQLENYKNLYNKEYHRTYYDSINFVSATNNTIKITVEQEQSQLSRMRPQYLLRNDSKPDPWGSTWSVSTSNGPMPPANYPRKGGSLKNQSINERGLPRDAVVIANDSSSLVCDSCHAPHSANTGMGTFILEANFDSTPVPGAKKSNGGTWNGAAEPSVVEDTPTCYLCHNK